MLVPRVLGDELDGGVEGKEFGVERSGEPDV